VNTEERLSRIESQIDRIYQMMVTGSTAQGKWMNEDEVMTFLNLSKKSLQILRRNGTLSVSSATGRKFKYLRKDVEKYVSRHAYIV
jgi:tRNA nucleotidyltransferase (CCA-adding enzyme)